ncbi:putative c6 zinc finger domain containing protein [Erysiphe necator]|uniref:Putative c6 zinc finger domain containing protein n=1 Tax=Uncinula necator TaxID=52586 RepID=A0A0B1NYR0_UNCNE|nr:putative c6 zinc finger domain containing protein [Erysiphe necator]
MPRVTASSRRLSECHPFVDGDVLAITDEVETNFNPVSSLPESKFVREPSTKLRTVQHQIEEIQHQSVSITRENTRLNQRNVNLDLEKNSNQVVTVAPSKTQMVELTTPSPSTSSSTAWPLPTPFDVGFNHNITVTCQNFMSGMLSSSIFKQCSPISMLLQNSNSFFQASKNLLRITSLLDNSCGAPVSVCSELLHSYSQNLTKHDACGLDLSHSNPQIESALLGLRAYQILYTVSCLRTSSPVVNINQKGHPITPNQTFSSIGRPEDSYCFADALTNISNPSNSFIYYLPLNVSLVGSAVPTCTTCLQSTMSVFQLATANRSSIIASNYAKAASQVNVVCGPEFVNASLTAAVSSANLIGAKRSLLILFWILLYFTFIE